MSISTVAEGAEVSFLVIALASAIYSTRTSFTKLGKNVRNEGSSIYLKISSGLVVTWLTTWLSFTILSIVYHRRSSALLFKFTGVLSALVMIFGSAAVPSLLIIQTVILSACTRSEAHSSAQKVYRFLIWAVASVLPLGTADAVLEYLVFVSGGSDQDMGHLGVMVAITIIHVAITVIEVLAVLVSLFHLVKYKSAFLSTAYYKPLAVVNGLSLIRHLYELVHTFYFGIGIDLHLAYETFLLRWLLVTIFTACTTAACSVLVVGIVCDYASDSSEEGSSHADETSPLLQDASGRGGAAVESG